jgi:hypothetical protein
MAELRGGATCESLRREFEAQTGLARQCFYNNFKLIKQWGWVIGGGGRDELYELNPAAPWKASQSTGEQDGGTEAEQLERAKRKATRLEYLVDTQAGEIQELRGRVDALRDLASGTNGVALESLIGIVRAASRERFGLRSPSAASLSMPSASMLWLVIARCSGRREVQASSSVARKRDTVSVSK